MQPIQFFQLASQQAQWLSARQSVISTNVANADTPGFKAKDLVPFTQFLDAATSNNSDNVNLASTNPMHFADPAQMSMNIREVDDKSGKISASGNNVGLAQEMIKANEARQDYDLNAGLVKALNKMMLMVVRR
ncbi:flagellar basal body rod protein FlgB [Rhizobium sp. C1]|uniref:flagellar basal body rod protein FlgB n=1 Tax=Rhizobium sp. C1 TaxID=1349799 RepID=UPI001E3EDD85|nr:flagellar basal body rod protein FlgB [Rhizobium sp. C1]MCD2179014.1 flagellar basal body rod protein FlgB [Rhizobium sp. C1]